MKLKPKKAKGDAPVTPANSSEPAAPRSIEDVARLFMGDAVVEGLVKDNSTAVQHLTAAKRARETVDRSPTSSSSSAAKKVKTKPPSDNAVSKETRHTAGVKSLSRSAGLEKEIKQRQRTATKKKKVTSKADTEEEEDEDVALSRAVQAQALSFLQHLNAKRSKAFWGMRDVAQGKGPKAANAAGDSSHASSSSSGTRKPDKKKKRGKKRTLVDDGEELWRVGGPYIPSDEEEDEQKDKGEDCGRSNKLGRQHGSDDDDDDDTASHSSATSSEPSWLTDSSDDEDEGEDEVDPDSSDVDDNDNDNGERGKKGRGASYKGGGRLFQGGDDIWDDDDG